MPDPAHRVHWIACSPGLRDAGGRALIPFTCWAGNADVPAGGAPIKEQYSHVEIMRLENPAEAPEPAGLRFTWLQQDRPLTVPHARIRGASFAQEPYLARLADGRLFMVMRSNRGEVWHSVSADDGVRWRDPQVMRQRDGGAPIRQPASPCALFGLERGDFLLAGNDNDGSAHGAEHVWDVRNRRPGYLYRGAFRAGAWQPIW